MFPKLSIFKQIYPLNFIVNIFGCLCCTHNRPHKKTSLVIKVKNVFLWAILMGKRGDVSTIWMLVISHFWAWPSRFFEVVRDPLWWNAMKQEIDALGRNDT
ncbi:hypothetical protein CR513_35761, partial [Mucuna pruriens]